MWHTRCNTKTVEMSVCPVPTTNTLLKVIIIVVCLMPLVVNGKVWRAAEFPMIHLQDENRYVCDPEGFLSAKTRSSVDALLRKLEQTRGVQTVVAVADSVEYDDCYGFGMSLAQRNGVGSKKQNTGLVIILSPGCRCYYILTGHGLEGSLPDAICKRIENRYMLPHLQSDDWDSAILGGVRAVCSYLQNDESLLPEKKSSTSEDNAPLIAFVITLAIIFAACMLFSRTKSSDLCPNCKKHTLRPTGDTLQRTADGVEMVIYRCSNCGYSELRDKHDDNNDTNGTLSSLLLPFLLLGGRRGGGSMFGGSGIHGGSFGGGTFGGGGAGGKF